jgi:hypothetical protein
MLVAVACVARTIPTVSEGVEDYSSHMKAAMSSAEPVSLEKAFEEGLSAAEALECDQLE